MSTSTVDFSGAPAPVLNISQGPLLPPVKEKPSTVVDTGYTETPDSLTTSGYTTQPRIVSYPHPTDPSKQGATVMFPAEMDEPSFHSAAKAAWSQLKGEVGALSQGLGGPATADEAKQGLNNTPAGFTHPWESLKAAVSGVVGSANNADLMDKAKASWQSGDRVAAVRHGVAALLPFVGKNADIAGDEAASGDYAKAVGHTLAAVLPFLIGGTEAPETAAKPSPKPAAESAGETAARESAMPPRTSAATSSNISTEQASARVQNLLQEARMADAKAASAKLRGAGEVKVPTTGPAENIRAATTPVQKLAADYANRQYGGAKSTVREVGGQNVSEHPAGTTTSSEIERTGVEAPATTDEINAYLRKQFGNRAPKVTVTENEPVTAPRLSSEGETALAAKEVKKVSAQQNANFGYEKTAGQLQDLHRVSITDKDGKPLGQVEATNEPTTDNTWTVRHARSQVEGANLGTTAYTKLLDQMQKEVDRTGKPYTLRGDASMSDAAREGVWRGKLAKRYDVKWAGDRPSITLSPTKPAASDVTGEWQQYAKAALAGEPKTPEIVSVRLNADSLDSLPAQVVSRTGNRVNVRFAAGNTREFSADQVKSASNSEAKEFHSTVASRLSK